MHVIPLARPMGALLLPLLLLAALPGCGDGADGTAADSTGAPLIDDLTAAGRDTTGAADAEAPVRMVDFETVDLEGKPFHLGAYQGKVILLNFWATWCAPCRIEMPDFVKLQAELGSRGLQIVGVSTDLEGEEVVRPFVAEMGITYPVVVDIGEIAEMYGGVYALPTTVIIDRQGDIHRKVTGMMTEAELRPLLETLLAEAEG
jgi:peroxiredoxin